jgi:hypothetical protein
MLDDGRPAVLRIAKRLERIGAHAAAAATRRMAEHLDDPETCEAACDAYRDLDEDVDGELLLAYIRKHLRRFGPY